MHGGTCTGAWPLGEEKCVVGLRVMTNESSNNLGIWGPQWPTLSQTLHLIWD